MFGVQGKFLTLPNILSLSRGILIFPAVYFATRGTLNTLFLATLFGIVMILTDAFDGFIARKTGSVSEWGKILDPLIDKFCVLVAVIAVVILRGFPIYAAAIIVGRDICILATSFVIFRRRKIITVSHPIGKCTALITVVTLILYLIQAESIKKYFMYLTLCMIAVSSVFYSVRTIVRLRKM